MKRPETVQEMKDYAKSLRRDGFHLAAEYWEKEISFWYSY